MLSQPQGHSAIGRIMSMKNSNDTIWNRTSDLPIVAQYLNHCATAVRSFVLYAVVILTVDLLIIIQVHPLCFVWVGKWIPIYYLLECPVFKTSYTLLNLYKRRWMFRPLLCERAVAICCDHHTKHVNGMCARLANLRRSFRSEKWTVYVEFLCVGVSAVHKMSGLKGSDETSE
jgi:hypothetical protein